MNSPLSCALANYGVTIKTFGQLAPCCQYPFTDQRVDDQQSDYTNFSVWKTTKMQDLRNSLEQGIRVKECNQCWMDEDNGQSSLRQESNKSYNFDDPTFTTRHAEFRLGNYCNLKCIMCSPISSSSIETEYLQHKKLFDSQGFGYATVNNSNHYWETDEFDRLLDQIIDQLSMLHFTGGEPLMVPGLLKILDRVKNKNTVSLQFVSNLTKVPNRLIEKFKLFKNIDFSVSLEGVGAHNNYIRYPSQFNEIESNLRLLQGSLSNVRYNINHVFQNTSVYALPTLAKWCQNKNLNLHFSPNYYKEEFSLQSVPTPDLARFRDWVETTQDLSEENQTFILNNLKGVEFNSALYYKFKQYTDLLDSIRQTNYNQTFNPTILI